MDTSAHKSQKVNSVGHIGKDGESDWEDVPLHHSLPKRTKWKLETKVRACLIFIILVSGGWVKTVKNYQGVRPPFTQSVWPVMKEILPKQNNEPHPNIFGSSPPPHWNRFQVCIFVFLRIIGMTIRGDPSRSYGINRNARRCEFHG